MKGKDIKVGSTYAVKVCGNVVPVRITGESIYGGWDGMNLITNRDVRIRGAARLRWEVVKNAEGKWAPVRPAPAPATERGHLLPDGHNCLGAMICDGRCDTKACKKTGIARTPGRTVHSESHHPGNPCSPRCTGWKAE